MLKSIPQLLWKLGYKKTTWKEIEQVSKCAETFLEKKGTKTSAKGYVMPTYEDSRDNLDRVWKICQNLGLLLTPDYILETKPKNEVRPLTGAEMQAFDAERARKANESHKLADTRSSDVRDASKAPPVVNKNKKRIMNKVKPIHLMTPMDRLNALIALDLTKKT